MTYTLYLGDCLEYMKSMPDKSVDAVITDPPYGVDFEEWDSRSLEDMFSVWLEEMIRVSSICTFTCGWPRLADYCIIKKPTGYLYWYKPGCMGFSPFGFTNVDPMPVYGKIKMRGQTDVIKAPIIVTNKYHPTQKPLAWAMQGIVKISAVGDTIFDPFMGSGTTGVAAIQLGRNFIGCEIDRDYFAIAEKRIKEATLQPQLFAPEKIKEIQEELL